jgi:MYXO-CTERM domain-containing protein
VCAFTGAASGEVVHVTFNASVVYGFPMEADLNADGLVDLRFDYLFDSVNIYHSRVLVLGDMVRFSEWESPSGVRPLARAMEFGETIGPGFSFPGPADLVGLLTNYSKINGPEVLMTWGPWGSIYPMTAGFRFADSDGAFHYGWFSGVLDYSSSTITGAPGSFTVIEYAYESTPDAGITVPAPAAATLGAACLAFSRRRRR